MPNFTAGQRLRASEINDALSRAVFKVTINESRSIPDGDYLVPWEGAPVDSNGMWTPSNEQVVTVRTAGVWLLVMAVRLSSFDGQKGAYITLNGEGLDTDAIVASTSDGSSILQATGVVQLSENDELRGIVAQRADRSLDLMTDYGGTYMTGVWLGELA